MIVASGYVGKSSDSFKERLMSSKEHIKNNKRGDKVLIKYSTQTLIMSNDFNVIDEGFISPKLFENEVSCVRDFTDFIVNTAIKKHKKPEYVVEGNKYTIISKLNEDLLYVDIIEISEN